MKKQLRTIIISGAVLAVLLIVWIGSSLLPDKNTAATTAETTAIPPVYKTAAENVSRIDVKNKSGEVSLLPQAAKDSAGKDIIIWRIDGKSQYLFSEDALAGVVDAAINVGALQEVGKTSADLAAFGLDKPYATITVTLKTGEKHMIKYGNAIMSGNSEYVMLDDTGRICSVSGEINANAKVSIMDLLDKGQVTDIAQNDLTSFTFIRAKDNFKIAATCSLTGSTAESTAFLKFTLSEPLAIGGNNTNLATLAGEATGISASKFIEMEPQDLAKYGLDKPQYSFTLTSKAKTVRIRIGNQAEGNTYYAISDAVPAVFTMDGNTFQSTDLNLLEMIDLNVCLVNIWQVHGIDANLFGTKFTAEIKMAEDAKVTDDTVVFRLNGRDAKILNENNGSLFTAFYSHLTSPKVAGLDLKVRPVNTHEAFLTFHVKEDTANNVKAFNKMIEFVRRDDYTYYVFKDGIYTGYYVNGESAFTQDQEGFTGMIPAFEKMIYAMDHAVNGVFNTEKGYQLN